MCEHLDLDAGASRSVRHQRRSVVTEHPGLTVSLNYFPSVEERVEEKEPTSLTRLPGLAH